MAKKIQLTIPEPCHENWDDMTPVDKGRFCGSCQKQVVDFSNMSDREVAQFFKKPGTGSVCGRFMQDQLDRDMEIPKKRIPWIKYFFQIAVPAFLFSNKAKAQGEVRLLKPEKCVLYNPITKGEVVEQKKEILTDTTTIKGRVVDDQNTPLSYVSIVIKGTRIGTITDSTGYFSLKIKDVKEDITIQATYVGFSTVEKRVKMEDIANKDSIILVPLNPHRQGQIVVVGMISPKKKSKSKAKPIPIISEIKDTIVKAFKVYPNPVSPGSIVTLEWKETEEGYYSVQLLNQSGQVVFTKEIWIDAEARVLNLDLPTVIAGSYFIRVTNKKSGKNSAEKIIIQ